MQYFINRASVFIVLIFMTLAIGNSAFSQTCPTYLRRNNGNNSPSSCGSTVGIPNASTWIKQGSFEFTVVTDVLNIDKVERYNSSNSSWEIFQDNTSNPLVYNSSIWFGGYSGSNDKWICFYSPDGTQAPPAAIILIQVAPYPSPGKPSLLKSKMVNLFYVGLLLLNKTPMTLWCNIV